MSIIKTGSKLGKRKTRDLGIQKLTWARNERNSQNVDAKCHRP